MFTCVYICVHLFVCARVCVCTCLHLFVFTFVCVYICLCCVHCMYVFASIEMYIMYVCVCVCACVCLAPTVPASVSISDVTFNSKLNAILTIQLTVSVRFPVACLWYTHLFPFEIPLCTRAWPLWLVARATARCMDNMTGIIIRTWTECLFASHVTDMLAPGVPPAWHTHTHTPTL